MVSKRRDCLKLNTQRDGVCPLLVMFWLMFFISDTHLSHCTSKRPPLNGTAFVNTHLQLYVHKAQNNVTRMAEIASHYSISSSRGLNVEFCFMLLVSEEASKPVCNNHVVFVWAPILKQYQKFMNI
jgi:hypothetical protein